MDEYRHWGLAALFPISALICLITSTVAAQENPGWNVEIGGTVNVNGTDNVELSDIDRRSDVVTTSELNVGTTRSTPKTDIRVGANLAWDAYARESSLNGVRYNALTSVRSDFFDRRLSFDLTANTNEQSINSGGAQSAVDRSIDSNRTQVVNFSAQPALRTAIGRWAIVEARYALNGAYFVSTDTSDDQVPLSDSLIHRGTVSVTSGPRFSRLRLSGEANIEKTDRDGTAQSSDRKDIQASADYLIRPRLTLTSTIGYEEIFEPAFNEDLEDPFGNVGFRWSPSPRTRIDFSGGYRYQGPNFEGRISYAYSQLINLEIRYSESIESQQRLVTSNLGNLTFDDAGLPVDLNTGNPLDPGGLPFDLQDTAFKRDAVNLGISGSFGRNRYRVGGRFEERNTQGVVSDQLSADLQLSRDLTPRSDLTISGSYQETNAPTGGGNITWRGSVSHALRLSDTATLSTSYFYLKQDSPQNVSFHENVLQIRISKSF